MFYGNDIEDELTSREATFTVRFVKITYNLIILTITVLVTLVSCGTQEGDEQVAKHSELAEYEAALLAFGDPPPLVDAWLEARERALNEAETVALPLEASLNVGAREPSSFAWIVPTERSGSYEIRIDSPVEGVMVDLLRVDEDGPVRIGELQGDQMLFDSPAGADYIVRVQTELLATGAIDISIEERAE